jgi:hypothetical protein
VGAFAEPFACLCGIGGQRRKGRQPRGRCSSFARAFPAGAHRDPLGYRPESASRDAPLRETEAPGAAPACRRNRPPTTRMGQ